MLLLTTVSGAKSEEETQIATIIKEITNLTNLSCTKLEKAFGCTLWYEDQEVGMIEWLWLAEDGALDISEVNIKPAFRGQYLVKILVAILTRYFQAHAKYLTVRSVQQLKEDPPHLYYVQKLGFHILVHNSNNKHQLEKVYGLKPSETATWEDLIQRVTKWLANGMKDGTDEMNKLAEVYQVCSKTGWGDKRMYWGGPLEMSLHIADCDWLNKKIAELTRLQKSGGRIVIRPWPRGKPDDVQKPGKSSEK